MGISTAPKKLQSMFIIVQVEPEKINITFCVEMAWPEN